MMVFICGVLLLASCPYLIIPSVQVGMVDTIFADVAQPDQARIVTLNASYFLKVSKQAAIFCVSIYVYIDLYIPYIAVAQLPTIPCH